MIFFALSFSLFSKNTIYFPLDTKRTDSENLVKKSPDVQVLFATLSNFNQRIARIRNQATHAPHNALINTVNYHHSVINLAQCGKTINYRACKATLYQPLCLYHLPSSSSPLPCPPSYPPKYHPEILFEYTVFRKAKFTFIRPLYTRNALARVGQIYIYLYECLWRRHFSTYFSSRSAVIYSFFFFFYFFYSHYSPLQKRVLYGLSNETPDRYRRISHDNFFFYHSETIVVAPAKRSRQHIHVT